MSDNSDRIMKNEKFYSQLSTYFRKDTWDLGARALRLWDSLKILTSFTKDTSSPLFGNFLHRINSSYRKSFLPSSSHLSLGFPFSVYLLASFLGHSSLIHSNEMLEEYPYPLTSQENWQEKYLCTQYYLLHNKIVMMLLKNYCSTVRRQFATKACCM
jgi:hypothetical protein